MKSSKRNIFTLKTKFSRTGCFAAGALWAAAFVVAPAFLNVESPAYAQEITGDIAGNVVDPSGAVLPGATVQVTNIATEVSRTVATGDSGQFVVSRLQIGTYRIKILSPGFKSFDVSDIVVTAAGRIRLEAKLSAGSKDETVEVRADAVMLQTDSGSVGSTISEKAIQDLPMNGRNFVNLVQIQPGVNAGVPGSLGSGTRAVDRRQSSTFSANGQSDVNNNFMLDGLDNNERFQGLIGIRPSIEALREVAVTTNNYDPELGRTSGAVTVMLTKSGTNQFHGSAYEYFRNDVTDAKDFFAGSIRKPKLRQNQFGGSVGGPIWKNKTFFFGDYEGFRQVDATGTVYTSTVPTAYQNDHPGDFSDVGGSVIPSAFLNSTGLAYFKLYPKPNQAGTVDPTTHVPSLNYVSNPARIQNQNTFDVRLDHSFNANNMIFGRYSRATAYTVTPSAFPVVNGVHAGGAFGGNYAGTTNQIAHSAQLNYTHIFTPRVLMELRAGYLRFGVDALAENAGTNYNDGAYLIPGVNSGVNNSGLATLIVSGYTPLGDALYLPLTLKENNFQYNGALTWTKGNHTVKLGGAVIRRQVADFNSPAGKGYFYFPLGGNPAANMQTLLTGRYFVYIRQALLKQLNFRFWEPSGFVQDTWRATQKFTLTYGLRYDMFTAPQEKNGNLSNFDLNSLSFVVGNNAGIKTQRSNVSPRVGFSAQVMKNTVLRGGFGMSYFPTDLSNNDLLLNPPYSYATGTVVNLTTSLSSGVTPPPAATSTATPTGSVFSKVNNYRNGLMEQFNLFLQHDVHGNVITVGYVGELGKHLNQSYSNINIAAPNGTATPSPAPYATKLPSVNTIAYYGDGGTSSYHALQANFERGFSHGFRVQTNYTLARGLDNATAVGPGNGEATGLLPFNQHYDYGNSSLDVRHRLAGSFNYELPFGKNASGLRKLTTGGWQLNAMGFWQTGTPFTVQSAIQHINVSSTVTIDRPNMVRNPNSGPKTTQQFFDTSAFIAQAVGTAGNEARNQLYGPHARKLDLSFFKTIEFRESLKLQLRAEGFNMTNTANFTNPGSTITAYTAAGVATSAGGFGSITSTNANASARQFQFAAKLLF